MDEPDLRFDGPADAAWTVVLAHGAGAGMDTPFLQHFAQGLADAGFRAARFDFPYMVRQRREGRQRAPDREPKLVQTWNEVKRTIGVEPRRLVIGGKSMGGRVASMIADEAAVGGLVCLGYPFHPPGKPERTRTSHLETLATPALILQGERDPFGRRDEVAAYSLSDAVRVHWLPDGDHGFKPRKASGRNELQNWDEALAQLVEFVRRL